MLSDTAQNMSGSYSFSHISDPHLTDPQGASWHSLIGKRLFGYYSWRTTRRHKHLPAIFNALIQFALRDGQHLVITGDLTQLGLPHECEQIRECLRDLMPPEDLTIVPGNHDIYARASREAVMDMWKPWMTGDEPDTSFPFPFPFIRRRGPVAFIGLCSAIPTRTGLASGKISSEQLEALPKVLSHTRAMDLFRVILIHHSPATGHDSKARRLVNGNEVCRILDQEGAELVLHGHDHHVSWYDIETSRGKIPTLCPSSASASGLNRKGEHISSRRACYHLCTVSWDTSQEGRKTWQLSVDTHQLDDNATGTRVIGHRAYYKPFCHSRPGN